MIRRMIALLAQMLLPARLKCRFIRFQMIANTAKPISKAFLQEQTQHK